MISVILAFRFPSKNACSKHELAMVETLISYWKEAADNFSLDLVFIDDHNENFWIKEPFIHRMVGQKRNWNMAAARNYGATLAKGDRYLFTDFDHFIFGELNQLDSISLDNKYFKFERVSFLTKKKHFINPHTNTFLIKREDFLGFDEDFCGNYGYEDSEFFYRLNLIIRLHHIPVNVAVACVFDIPRFCLSKDKSINKEKFLSKTTGKG